MEGRAEQEESYICPPQPRPVKDPRQQAGERPLIATHDAIPSPGTKPFQPSYSAPRIPGAGPSGQPPMRSLAPVSYPTPVHARTCTYSRRGTMHLFPEHPVQCSRRRSPPAQNTKHVAGTCLPHKRPALHRRRPALLRREPVCCCARPDASVAELLNVHICAGTLTLVVVGYPCSL